MYIFIGLGNPGQKYANTKHNLGFIAIDKLSKVYSNNAVWKNECKAFVQKVRIAGVELLLAKPQTFMNLSGESVQALISFYKIKTENILVFSDDINLALGKIRVRSNGSAGGQNGLKSIIERVGDKFARVRIGAGICPPNWELSNWVLSAFSKEDIPLCEQTIDKIPSLCETYLTKGVAAAQNEFN